MLNKRSWMLEAVMVMSTSGEVIWKYEDSKMFRLKSGRMMVFYKEEEIFSLKMTIAEIRLTTNVTGDWRGMWQDGNNQWWERFLRRRLMDIINLQGRMLVFYYVDKSEVEVEEFEKECK